MVMGGPGADRRSGHGSGGVAQERTRRPEADAGRPAKSQGGGLLAGRLYNSYINNYLSSYIGYYINRRPANSQEVGWAARRPSL